MSDELHICTSRTELYADSEPACLHVEDERLTLMLDEMENAYRYELWQCLEKIGSPTDTYQQPTIFGKIANAIKVICEYIATKFSDLTTALNIETISQAEVQNMWSDTPTPPTGGVTLVDGYLVGATIDNDGYLLATGFEIDNNNYIKLN